MSSLYSESKQRILETQGGTPKDYSQARLPKTGDNFYSELGSSIIPCCGYEFGTPDFHSALDLLNDRLNLQLDDTDLKAFSLMLTGLSQARRFRGDLHIPPVMGENSAAHTLHAIILATEAMRRTGVLSNESSPAESEVVEMHRNVCLGLLVHDMGEILGELSSLAQRTAQVGLEEQPDVERDIFQIALTEAYRSISSPECLPAHFYLFLRNMREQARIGEGKGGSTNPATLSAAISEYKEAQRQRPLDGNTRLRIDTFMERYDTAELKNSRSSNYAGFIGNAVKVIEHLQGLRHMLRFAAVDERDVRLHLTFPSWKLSSPQGPWVTRNITEMIPLRYTSNYRMRKNAEYMHSGLKALSESAETLPQQLMAKELRRMLYQGMAEWLSVTRPVVDRTTSAENEFLVTTQKKLSIASSEGEKAQALETLNEYSKHLLRHDVGNIRELRLQGFSRDSFHRYETRGRLIALYLKAIEKDFIPTSDTPLFLLDAVPEELCGFHTIDYTKLLGRRPVKATVAASDMANLTTTL